MFLAFVLAATTAAPSPSPSLASLRIIANVRSTPMCSTMRTRVGPAIAALLENDATLDRAPMAFDRIYRDKLLSSTWGWGQPDPRGFINLGNLESLIGPIAKNLKQIDDQLADTAFSQPRLAAVKTQLESVEAQQKAALNILSGYDATSLTWGILTAGETTLAVSQPSPRIFSQFDSMGLYSGARVSRQGPRSTPGRFDISLAYNPYAHFSQAVIDMRAAGSDAESLAATTIAPIVESCQAR